MQTKKDSPKLGGWATVAKRGKVRREPPPVSSGMPMRPPPGLGRPHDKFQRKQNSRFPSRDEPRYHSNDQSRYNSKEPQSYEKYRQMKSNERSQGWESQSRYPYDRQEAESNHFQKSYNRGFNNGGYNKYAQDVEDFAEGPHKPKPMRSDGKTWWRSKTVKQDPTDTREQKISMDPKFHEEYKPVNLDRVNFKLSNQRQIKSLNMLFPPRPPTKSWSYHTKTKIYRHYVKVPFPLSEKYAPDDPYMLELEAKAKRLLRQRDTFAPKELKLPVANEEREHENYLASLQEREKKEKEMFRMYEQEMTDEELRQMYEEEMYLKAYEEENLMREMYEREIYERELYEAELLAQAKTPAEREAIERDIYMQEREMYEAQMYERAMWERQMYGDEYGAEFGAEYGYGAEYGADYGADYDYASMYGKQSHRY